MAKTIIIVLAVVGLAQLASARFFEATCMGVQQIPFADMEKEDNICHFLVKEDEVEQKDRSLEGYDKVHICGCNLWNKGNVWANQNNLVVRKLNQVIDNRIFVLNLEKTTYFEDLVAMPKETLQETLLNPDENYKAAFQDELPSDEIKKGCINMFNEFNPMNKFFDNLSKYSGDVDVTQSIVSGNPDLRQVVRVFKVCKQAEFSE